MVMGGTRIIHRDRRLFASYVVILACGVGLVLSGSVTGMIAAVLALCGVLVRRRLSFKALCYGLTIIMLAYVAGTFLQHHTLGGRGVSPLDRLTASTGGGTIEQNTFESRLGTDRIALGWIAADPIFGRGLDPSAGATIDDLPVHNMFLLLWAQGGLLLALALLLVLTRMAHVVLAVGGRSDPLKEQLVGGALAALIFAMTAPITFQRYFWLPLILLLVYEEFTRGTTMGAGVRGGRAIASDASDRCDA